MKNQIPKVIFFIFCCTVFFALPTETQAVTTPGEVTVNVLCDCKDKLKDEIYFIKTELKSKQEVEEKIEECFNLQGKAPDAKPVINCSGSVGDQSATFGTDKKESALNIFNSKFQAAEGKETAKCSCTKAGVADPIVKEGLSLTEADLRAVLDDCFSQAGAKASLSCSSPTKGDFVASSKEQGAQMLDYFLGQAGKATAEEGKPLGVVEKLPNLIATDNINVIFGRVISFIISIAGSFALLIVVYGGVMWLISRGNPDYITKGKNAIKFAVYGLVIIFTSYLILKLIIVALGVVT